MNSKARQTAKLTELREALLAAGYSTLNAQSAVLGLNRSTTWTIIAGRHKSTGLSPAIINRMLAAPDLPATVRDILLQYLDERLAGVYGHNAVQLEAFSARVALTSLTKVA
jgi:hypothetical protein